MAVLLGLVLIDRVGVLSTSGSVDVDASFVGASATAASGRGLRGVHSRAPPARAGFAERERECETLPRGVSLDQWDFFGVPRRGDHGNESGYGESYFILTLWDKLVAAGAKPTRSVANLGANDGVSGDPTFQLFESGWSGLAVEPSKEVQNGFVERPLWERLWENLPWDRVVKDDTPVTPNNVIAIFERARLPHDLDVLKIDLDSYDIFVVERLLRHSPFRPKIIVMEINEKIPPPIMFAPNFRREYKWAGDHFMASSASMVVRTLQPLGYRSVVIDWNNIVLLECVFSKTTVIYYFLFANSRPFLRPFLRTVNETSAK